MGIENKLMFFYALWCPHSIKALPVWNKFKEEYVGEIDLCFEVEDYECSYATKQHDEKLSRMLDSLDVDRFPTILLIKGKDRIEFINQITVENLEEFLKVNLSS